MKILITTDNIGGVWTFTMNLAGGLKRNGHDVFVAVTGNQLSEHQLNEIRPYRWSMFECKQEWMQNPWDDVAKAGDWLLDINRSYQPDMVHLNSYSAGLLQWGVPVVITAHSCMLSWWEAVRNEAAPSEWNIYGEHVRTFRLHIPRSGTFRMRHHYR